MAHAVTGLTSPDKDYMILYEVSDKGQVAISRFGFESNKPIFRYEQRPGPDGAIKIPGCIDSAYLFGLPTVWGPISFPKDPKKPTDAILSAISQISPTFYSIAEESDIAKVTLSVDDTVNGSVAAASDNKDQVWVYYLQKKATNDAHLLIQCAYIKSGKDKSEFGLKNAYNAALTSRLGAVCITDTSDIQRIVFYRNASEAQVINYIIFTDDDSTAGSITGTDYAAEKTSLATVFAGEDGKKSVYLYYLDTNSDLFRTHWNSRTRKWSQPGKVPGAAKNQTPPLSQTQLTVVAGSQKNYVFYIPKDAKDGHYGYITDDWVS